jgi:hypothetical protein
MKPSARVLLTGLLLLGPAAGGRAEFLLTLSSPDNLSSVHVGQTVHVNVTLSGVATGGPLDSLGATVQISPGASMALFSIPSISAGPIVPSGGGFMTAPQVGIADATYDDLFNSTNHPISTDGVFYSFSLVAASPGSGTFGFTFLSGFQGFDSVPVSNGTPNGLAFTISPAASAVPEPSSLVLACSAAFAAVGCAWRRRQVAK